MSKSIRKITSKELIEMIREAANDTGEYFLEQVDTQSMGGSGGGYG